MPIPFDCPHCGHHTNVADQYAGQSGPCVACGQTIVVPRRLSPAGEAVAFPPPSPSVQSSGTHVVLLILVVVLVCLMLCGGLFAALLLPAVGSAREAARKAQCSNNLKQIALAFHNYHDTYGVFPAAYVADQDGTPMHSWRVAILPFMDQQALYDQYDFDEPWDGPNNRLLHQTSVPQYRCPSDPGPSMIETSYIMVVGENALSDGPGQVDLRKIEDGISNTIMIVELAASGIHWMEPRDLDVEQLVAVLGSGHADIVNVAMCDGSVRPIAESIDPEVLEAMCTIDGDEEIDDF